MKALVEYVAKSLVQHPEAVTLEERLSTSGTVLELSVAPDDVGRIIGRKGQTIKALRQLVSVGAARMQTKISLMVTNG